MLKARIPVASAGQAACILDLSSRGLMLQTLRPPERNSFLEIRRGPHVIVKRVMWANGHRAGLKARDELPQDKIVSEVGDTEGGAQSERRRFPRRISQREKDYRR